MRLGDLEKLGIVAIAQAGELRLRAAPGVITDELAARIRAVKPELLRELQQRQGATTESATATAEGQPTPAQAAELRRLVRHCGELYNFTTAEHREALEIALADHESALTCFRAMAAGKRAFECRYRITVLLTDGLSSRMNGLALKN